MNFSVLVVDDEKDIRDMVSIALTTKGYRVIRATNGVEALDAIGQYQPNAVILDLMMPRMTGYEVVDTLQQDGRLYNIPVIIFTARDLDDADYARLDGTRAIFQKGGMDVTALVDNFTALLLA